MYLLTIWLVAGGGVIVGDDSTPRQSTGNERLNKYPVISSSFLSVIVSRINKRYLDLEILLI